LDRMYWDDALSHRERVRLYHRYLAYWDAVLDHMRPDMFVTPVAPHLMYDYVLYALCKRRGIPTAMFLETAMPEFMLPVRRFEDHSETVLSARGRRHVVVADALPDGRELVAAHLERLRASYDVGMPHYMEKQLAHLDAARKYRAMGIPRYIASKLVDIRRYPHFARTAMRILLSSVALPPRSYLRVRGERADRGRLSRWKYRQYLKRGARFMRYLFDRYSALAERVDLGRPFVFVPLTFQPERTSCPEGGAFCDQLAMVELLSRSLPVGWKIYVKEHPSQFQPSMHGEHGRTARYYDDLLSIPGVHLAQLYMTPFELVDSAQAVASLTSTAGWEAVNRGKAALIFGHPWYRGCEGVFYTPTFESCRDALARIAQGYRPDRQRLDEFVRALPEVCVRGYVEGGWAANAGVTDEQNALHLSEALKMLHQDGGWHRDSATVARERPGNTVE